MDTSSLFPKSGLLASLDGVDAIFAQGLAALEHYVAIYDGDIDFEEAFNSLPDFTTIAENVKTGPYVDIANSYKSNMDRVAKMGTMPLGLLFWASFQHRVLHRARISLNLDLDDTSQDGTPELQMAYAKAIEKIGVPTNVEAQAFGASAIKHLLHPEVTGGHPNIIHGFDALLGALVTSAYTAFETLAADLWVCAVDNFPQLASAYIQKNPDKDIKLSKIASEGFNLSGRMGRVLRINDKASFDSLKKTRQAYVDAFGETIKSVFDPYEPLRQAEQVRHLLAHRAGLVDQRFKSTMADVPAYANFAVGERIKLTGPLVRAHIQPCLVASIKLIRAVDDWSVVQT